MQLQKRFNVSIQGLPQRWGCLTGLSNAHGEGRLRQWCKNEEMTIS